MQHPDMAYDWAASFQDARRRAAEERRMARRAQAPSDDEELPAQLLVAWMHLAGGNLGEPAILELRGAPVRVFEEHAAAPWSGDAA